MPQAGWVLLQDTNGWQIVKTSAAGAEARSVELSAETSVSQLAAGLAEALQAEGYRSEPLVLALDASVCLAAGLTLESDGTRQRQAMLYQLEQWLPVAAEELVCDFLVHGHEVLGIAVRTEWLKPLVDELETREVVVQSIVPAALLALAHHIERGVRTDRHVVLWGQSGRVNVFLVDGGRPRSWQLCEAQPQDVAQRLEVEVLSHGGPVPVVACDLPQAFIESLARLPDVELTDPIAETLADAVAKMATGLLAGKTQPPVELRRDAIATHDPFRPVRGLLRLAFASAAALLLLSSGAMLWRAHCYEGLAERHRLQLAAVYREALPGQSIPAGIRSRLESERARLAGLRGNSKDLPERPSALVMLYQLLAAIPDGLRCRVLELRLERGKMQIEGELRSHGDADAIAAGLRGQRFRVELPRTQQLSGSGVGMRMMAEVADKPAAALRR